MTKMTDTFFINAGVNAQDLQALKGRSLLYIATLFLVGMSLSFAVLTFGNLIS